MSALLMRMRPFALYASRIGSSHRTFGDRSEQPTALAAADERLATRSEIDRLLASRVPRPSIGLPAASLPTG